MKGNKKIIDSLNGFLGEELAAICQYMVQAEMSNNMGFKKIHDAIKAQAMDEMKHAEKLIERIIFLGGKPNVSAIGKINIGKGIEDILSNDAASESDAMKSYNAGIKLAVNEHDEGSAEMLRTILKDEERHHEWLETQNEVIKQVGLQKYLAQQIG